MEECGIVFRVEESNRFTSKNIARRRRRSGPRDSHAGHRGRLAFEIGHVLIGDIGWECTGREHASVRRHDDDGQDEKNTPGFGGGLNTC